MTVKQQIKEYITSKATVTGYCIKFKALKDINIEVLEEVVKDGFEERDQ